MKRQVYYMLLGLMGGIMVSCNLDSDPIECPADYTGSLADPETKLVGSWTLTAINSDIAIDLTDDSTENASQNLFAQYADCDKDVRYVFGADRGYSFLLGQTASNCSNKRMSKGTWKLSVDQLSLVANCNIVTDKVTFTTENTQFSFTNNLNMRDVRGSTYQAKVTFVYSKAQP